MQMYIIKNKTHAQINKTLYFIKKKNSMIHNICTKSLVKNGVTGINVV